MITTALILSCAFVTSAAQRTPTPSKYIECDLNSPNLQVPTQLSWSVDKHLISLTGYLAIPVTGVHS
jgi:hypothetical protein